MCIRTCVAAVALALFAPAAVRTEPPAQATQSREGLIAANDNRRAAGALANGTLTVRLVAQQGEWEPEGPGGRTLTVQAFREESGPLTIPGPLVRVPSGTTVRAFIRNDIPGATLTVYGLGDRPSTGPVAPLVVPAGETRELRFLAQTPGTYHYWATTTNRPLGQRRDVDSPLSGAFVIDEPGATPDDRVFVVSVWQQPGIASDQPTVNIGTINGRSWPNTELLEEQIGKTVRWRVVNLGFDAHAMHLHGIYFSVLSNGDGIVSRAYAPAERPLAVTEYIQPGETFEMSWTPERPGHWLFHCHMVVHMSPPPGSPAANALHHDASSGMAGLVLGVRVNGSAPLEAGPNIPPRRFTLRIREEPNRYANGSGVRVDVEGIDAPRLAPGSVPGPTLILTRGEPVEAVLANDMTEPTAIHWHGIELESYFDGVPGWGGTVGSVTPAIMPGETFTAKFTPPRAGTFIYHTHWHDERQLSGGLYGALIVVEPGERYDPATDHIFIAGFDGTPGPTEAEPIALNGRNLPVPAPPPGPTRAPLRANVPNRLRLINITPNNVALTFALTDGFQPLAWKPVAKDGAGLPQAQMTIRDAVQLVSVGETYDFEFQPSPGQRVWLELKRGNGEWAAQALLTPGP